MFYRNRRGEDRWLSLKLILFALGAALGITGMLVGSDLLIGAAVLVLAVGLLLRFTRRPTGDQPPGPAGEAD